MILRIMLRPSHRSFAWLSQNILLRLLVIDLEAGKFRTMPAMKYRPAVGPPVADSGPFADSHNAGSHNIVAKLYNAIWGLIADPPILSSSPRNGSGTAMNADLSLFEQCDSSSSPARSLQNVPVRPPIAESTPAFFCTFLRISQKISISQRLRAGCSLDTEGIGRKSQEK